MESTVFKSHRIRLMERQDIPKVIAYIAKEVNPQHVFVQNPDFFEYEHCNGLNVNGILAENSTGGIDGILLMYPLGDKLAGNDFFGGIWSVSRGCKVPLLGFKLVKSVLNITGAKSHSGVGISPDTTAKIFRHIEGQRVGRLKHYYMLGDVDEYKIAKIKVKKIAEARKGKAKFVEFQNIRELCNLFDLSAYKDLPYYKDDAYIKKRYFDHPVYNYNLLGIEVDQKIQGILVMRVVECNGARIVRIIDFLGNDQALKECGGLFQRMISEEKLEYIDFYEHGLDDKALMDAGFIVREDSENIIPNYFEPYFQENIDLWFHTPYENCRIFKGDGDQDRPSIIK